MVNKIKKKNSINSNTPKWLDLHWYHWAIVFLSVILTLFAWRFTKEENEKRIQLKFESEALTITSLIKERLKLYESGLRGGVAAIRLNNDLVSNLEWKEFAQSLDIDNKYPGISGIGVIYNVSPNNLESFLRKQRKSRPDFAIHPKHNKEVFWPITYIEPSEPNFKAIGLDMAFEENRFLAAKKASRTGRPQITGPIVLVQDSEKTPGFLFYMPFYKKGLSSTRKLREKNFIGLVYAPFVFKNLMEGTLKNSNRKVNVKISDNDFVLIDELTDAEVDYDYDPMFSKTMNVELYGRAWNIKIDTSKSFRDSFENNQSVFILIFGLIIDSILFFLFITLSNSNRNAVAYANKVTKALKESNEELEQFSYRTSHDLVAPLKSISSLVFFIKEDLDDNNLKEVKANISKVGRLAEKLTALVGDILNLTKADNNSGPKEAINVDEIKEDILEKLDLLIVESKVKVSFEDKTNLRAYTNKVRLVQILENLISNGIKYHSPNQSESHVKVTLLVERKTLVIKVADNGLGIPKAYQHEVFQMFKRFNPKVAYGSGLGLYLVKKHIDWLEGQIHFSSSEEGTEFEVFIPM